MNKTSILPSLLGMGIVYGSARSGMFGRKSFNHLQMNYHQSTKKVDQLLPRTTQPMYVLVGICYDTYIYENGQVEYCILPPSKD